MADKRGYMRHRETDGSYSTFYPITKSDSVIIGENNESLKDHVSAVTTKLGDINTSLSGLKGMPQKVTNLESRLDSDNTVDVVINPGLQIIDAPKEAPLTLSGMKGQTLVNILGRKGSFESTEGWTIHAGTITALDNELSMVGNGDSYFTQILNPTIGPTPKAGDVYFLRARVKATANPANISYIGLYLYDSTSGALHGKVTVDNPVANETYELCTSVTIPESINWSTTSFIVSTRTLTASGAKGTTTSIKDAALYKLPTTDKALTLNELSIKYPFVNSIKPVQNPYTIRHGENLFPSFYEARTHSYIGHHVVKPYEALLEASASNQGWFLRLPCIPSQEYTFNATHNGVVALSTMDKDGKTIKVTYHTTGEVSFTSEANATFIDISLGNANKGPGRFTFTNPMLNLGSVAKPFVPREDTLFALQTELHSNPYTGEDREELFELNGQYLQTKKWHTVVLDENLDWKNGSVKTGFKEIYVPGLVARAEKGVGYGTKYNGDILLNLTPGVQTTAGDQMMLNTDNAFILTVSSTDSGWGDAYTPSVEEIKAYLLGWTMYNGAVAGSIPSAATLYNGTGTKWWARRSGTSWANATNTVPITKASDWSYYQFTYKLITPSAVPVTTEGRILLHTGKNHIEVGTGIVLRENTKVYTEYNTNVDIRCNINNASWGNESTLRNKAESILRIYKDNEHDPRWSSINSKVTVAGALSQMIYSATEDVSAAYSATYIMSEKSAMSSFTGSYSTTEKGIWADVNDIVHQQAAMISMLENKKSSTDIQKWVAPTLLNGWASYYQVPAFVKLDNGLVMFKGRMSSGVITSGTLLFTLPIGYRPDESRRLTVGIYAAGTTQTTTGTINISPNGQVTIDQFPGNAWVSLDGIIFRTYEK